MANIAVGDRVRAWYRHPLVRIGSSIFGVGLGFLIVIAIVRPGLTTPLGRGFGGVGLIWLIVGLGLFAAAWAKTKPT